MPGSTTGLYGAVLEWVYQLLGSSGSKATLKRLAVGVTGLICSEAGTVSKVSQAVAELGISEAKEPSIARRLLRLLADPAIDPDRVLLPAFRALLPQVLDGLVKAHEVNARTVRPAEHERFTRLRLVIDETSDKDAVHLLVVGLYYQGVVVPLGVRAWPQNQPIEEDAWWGALGSLLWDVHSVLPATLRNHVVLLADRGYSYPRMVDLLRSLNWAWVIRMTGTVHVRFDDGREQAVRDLVPRRGQTWHKEAPLDQAASPTEPVRVFKKAGWRQATVTAIWLPDQAQPWILLSNLPSSKDRLAEYAQRWSIERLFLCWKGHGWNIERGRIHDAVRFARLVSVMIFATWWRIALVLPAVEQQLAQLGGRPLRPIQLHLPFVQCPLPQSDQRPWLAKFSLFSWSMRVLRTFSPRFDSPPCTWLFPWFDESLTWSQRCTTTRSAPT